MQTQTFQVTTPAPREIWMNLLKSSLEALVTQSPTWLDCVCEIEGYTDSSRLYEMEDGGYAVLANGVSKIWPYNIAYLGVVSQ